MGALISNPKDLTAGPRDNELRSLELKKLSL